MQKKLSWIAGHTSALTNNTGEDKFSSTWLFLCFSERMSAFSSYSSLSSFPTFPIDKDTKKIAAHSSAHSAQEWECERGRDDDVAAISPPIPSFPPPFFPPPPQPCFMRTSGDNKKNCNSLSSLFLFDAPRRNSLQFFSPLFHRHRRRFYEKN